MTQTENEKELILGNKQLITLFFLVVAMCGAFFAFGYIIGRNGAKTTLAANAVSAETPAAAATSPAPAADTAGATPPGDAAPTPDASPAGTETQPAHDVPSATTPFSAQAPPPAAAAAPAVPAASPPVSARAAAPVPASEPLTLDPGATYLQVTALRKTDADNLVKTLRELNFPALTAESSKSDLFRVLVGPYRQMSQVADAKARLKTLGFANAFVQK